MKNWHRCRNPAEKGVVGTILVDAMEKLGISGCDLEEMCYKEVSRSACEV